MYKYAIISNLEGEKSAHKMSELPLHITFIGVFTSARNHKYFNNLLFDKLMIHHSFATAVIGREDFGKDGIHLMVSELSKTKELAKLQKDLIESISNDINTMNPDFLPETYRPHVTDQNDRHLEIGEQVLVDNLTLVEIIDDTVFERARISIA